MAITLDTLNASLHSVKISDGTNDLLIDGSGHLSINDGGNSLTVDSADLATIAGAVSGTEMQVDIVSQPALVHTTDSIKLGDGTDFLAINGDGSINVLTAPVGLDSWKTSTVSATSTVGEIAATPLANRVKMIIQNVGNQDVFLGEDNTVTTSTGMSLSKGSSIEMEYGATANIWAITASGTADLRVAEYAD